MNVEKVFWPRGEIRPFGVPPSPPSLARQRATFHSTRCASTLLYSDRPAITKNRAREFFSEIRMRQLSEPESVCVFRLGLARSRDGGENPANNSWRVDDAKCRADRLFDGTKTTCIPGPPRQGAMIAVKTRVATMWQSRRSCSLHANERDHSRLGGFHSSGPTPRLRDTSANLS